MTIGKRLALVIGSQCNALNRLDFVPVLATDLYSLLVDDMIGCCGPALGSTGLILDPDVAGTKAAIRSAYDRATREQATLIFAYIGHGEYAEGDPARDFFLLPTDAAVPCTSDTAIHFVQIIKDLHRTSSPGPDGLIVLIDTCYAGAAAAGAAGQWITALNGTLRFEVLTASSDGPARSGCFTRNIVKMLTEGFSEIAEPTIRFERLRGELEAACPGQVPQHPTFNADEGLFLAKNRAFRSDISASTVGRVTISNFQPTATFRSVMEALSSKRCTVVIGAAGTGKSALAAALVSRGETCDDSPFIHASVGLSGTVDTETFSRSLEEQLTVTVTGFAQAVAAFRRESPARKRQQFDAFQMMILGPLLRCAPKEPIRIVIDGLDQLSPISAKRIFGHLQMLATHPDLGFMRLVVTTRPDTPFPHGGYIVTTTGGSDEEIGAFLREREVRASSIVPIISRARGNWLVASLLAQFCVDESRGSPAHLPRNLSDTYAEFLRRAGATSFQRWERQLRPILSILAVCGTDPVVPLEVVQAAAAKLGGPDSLTEIHDVLVDLRGLVSRTAAGTGAERVGLFHPTFGSFLCESGSDWVVDSTSALRAITDVLGELAPPSRRDYQERLHRFALAVEADSFWRLREYDKAVQSLLTREEASPIENLNRLTAWLPLVRQVLGEQDTATLRLRRQIVLLTARCGWHEEAWRGAKTLIREHEEFRGALDADTFAVHSLIAFLTAKEGQVSRALEMYSSLLATQSAVQGIEHPDALDTRSAIAYWVGRSGDRSEALRRSMEVLPMQQRVLGCDDPRSMQTRAHIAQLVGELGDAGLAADQLRVLEEDRVRVLGVDHPETLRTRASIVWWTARSQDSLLMIPMLHELLDDQCRVLGPDHPDVLLTRAHIARCTGLSGHADQALSQFEELLPDQTRILGEHHPATIETRSQIAEWVGKLGRRREARRLHVELLRVVCRIFPAEHRIVLHARASVAHWTGRAGHSREALRRFEDLLKLQERILGKDHHDTLVTRANVLRWMSRVHHGKRVRRAYEHLLRDQRRLLGDNHRLVLRTRSELAFQIGKQGNQAEGILRLQELVGLYREMFGPNHPETHRTDNLLQYLKRHGGTSGTAKKKHPQARMGRGIRQGMRHGRR